MQNSDAVALLAGSDRPDVRLQRWQGDWNQVGPGQINYFDTY